MALLFGAHFITKSLFMTITANTTIVGVINDSESSNYFRENLSFNDLRLTVTFPKIFARLRLQLSRQ
jgi:hypothetical protein